MIEDNDFRAISSTFLKFSRKIAGQMLGMGQGIFFRPIPRSPISFQLTFV
jgi:hypothetical protein